MGKLMAFSIALSFLFASCSSSDSDGLNAPTIETPEDTICCEISPVTLKVANVNLDNNQIFVWYLNNEAIPNVTVSSYKATIPGVYSVKFIQDDKVSAISEEVTLTGIPTPTITSQIVNGTAVLTIENPVDHPSVLYAWYKPGSGAIDFSPSFISFTVTESGSYFATIKVGDCFSKKSNTLVINL